MHPVCRAIAVLWTGTAVLFDPSNILVCAAENDPETQRQLQQLRQQNEALQQQMRRQAELIDELGRKVSTLETAKDNPAIPSNNEADNASRRASGFSLGKVHIGGEGAVGFFHSQPNGQYPNAEFRVDEAKLFVEAPILGDVYFFGEINVFTREQGTMTPGELYLDAENLSRLWNKDRQLNLRLGRFDIPFGEEYLTRDAIDNPLISHSVVDLWGVDEGVELYGSFGKFSYVAAVQNGGNDSGRDFDGDKSVAVRLGLDPTPWLHVSASAMRTGDLDAIDDGVSELWLGPGLVYSLGSASTTKFEANLLEGDLQLKFPHTTVKAFGGVLQYDDNDPLANNRREMYYYCVEGTQRIYKRLYGAVRWSQIFADKGFPVAGNGDADTYAFSELTKELWLLSLGLGYRFSDQLILKAEYSFQRGRELDGTLRDEEDLFAATAAFGF